METIRTQNRAPTHPGAILREDVLPELAITQTEFAKRVGVSRLTISEILHEKRNISTDMAIRLGKFLGNGPWIWLKIQQTFDLWKLEQTYKKEYSQIHPIFPSQE